VVLAKDTYASRAKGRKGADGVDYRSARCCRWIIRMASSRSMGQRAVVRKVWYRAASKIYRNGATSKARKDSRRRWRAWRCALPGIHRQSNTCCT